MQTSGQVSRLMKTSKILNPRYNWLASWKYEVMSGNNLTVAFVNILWMRVPTCTCFIQCHSYNHKLWVTTKSCINGEWSKVLTCTCIYIHVIVLITNYGSPQNHIIMDWWGLHPRTNMYMYIHVTVKFTIYGSPQNH